MRGVRPVDLLDVDDVLPARPRRVTVAGVSGAGKTTTANRIAAVTGGRRTEIDGLFHGPDWTPLPTFQDDVRSRVAEADWVIEWQYDTARPLIAARADLLVWLDLPFWRTTYPRLVRRTVRRRRRRETLWNGNEEAPLRSLADDRDHILRYTIRMRHRPATNVERLRAARPELPIVRLRSQREVDRWLAGPLRDACRAERPA